MKLSAKEVQEKGIEFCKNHPGNCTECPLMENEVCIDDSGELLLNGEIDEDGKMDFLDFMRKFNFMLETIGAAPSGK